MQVLAVILPLSRTTSNFALSCGALRLWLSNNGFPIKTSKRGLCLATFQFYKSLSCPGVDEWMSEKVFRAIKADKTNDLQLLMKHKSNIEAKGREEDTALTRAALYGKFNCLKLLVNHKADLEATDKYGNTALLLSAWNGKLPCLRLLLQNKADVKAQNNKGVTALTKAGGVGRADCRRLLLQYGATENFSNSTL